MRRRRVLFHGGIAVLLMGALLTTAQSSQANETNPGLPEATFGNWTSASQGGMSYAKRAKQWFISPMAMATAEANFSGSVGSGDRLIWARAAGYFVSPEGAPAEYGYLEPMTVRSVGFGLMPVEATVQISQRRENGLPVPVAVMLRNEVSVIPKPSGGTRYDYHFPEVTIEDSFNVRILSVRVDGVDMRLTGECRTAEPAPIKMRTPAYTREDASSHDEQEWYRTRDPSTYFNVYYGGELTGTMTIPPFTGCTTESGDDLSRLLTLSASGPDNPVMARVGWQCQFMDGSVPEPAPPGMSNPSLGAGHVPGPGLHPDYCPGIKPFEYPERDAQ